MWRRCLGDLPFKEDGREVVDCTPEMRRIELQPGDSAVVLATDGLWDVMSDTDVVGIVTKARPSPFCACNIIAKPGIQQIRLLKCCKWRLAQNDDLCEGSEAAIAENTYLTQFVQCLFS